MVLNLVPQKARKPSGLGIYTMVRMDAQVLRYMSKDEFRVLTAMEMGMRNHDLVPTVLICRIAGLKRGGAFKVIKLLHKNKLVFHQSTPYDGYRLTYRGYDYLALKTLVQRGHIAGIGRRIGVGKESDIFEVINDEGTRMVAKIHRLGRVSFRKIKQKRDYMGKRTSASWMYMSRLAALREFAYMKALYKHEFPIPVPIDHNRHIILMSLVDAHPFSQVRKLAHPHKVYADCMNLVVRFAEHGLIHCDFNEFNLMVADDESVICIDFPQMVSTSHPNARFYFDRDVNCVHKYFVKRFRFRSDDKPKFFDDLSGDRSGKTGTESVGGDGSSSPMGGGKVTLSAKGVQGDGEAASDPKAVHGAGVIARQRIIALDEELAASGHDFTKKQMDEFNRFLDSKQNESEDQKNHAAHVGGRWSSDYEASEDDDVDDDCAEDDGGCEGASESDSDEDVGDGVDVVDEDAQDYETDQKEVAEAAAAVTAALAEAKMSDALSPRGSAAAHTPASGERKTRGKRNVDHSDDKVRRRVRVRRGKRGGDKKGGTQRNLTKDTREKRMQKQEIADWIA